MVQITLTNEMCGMDETLLCPPSPAKEVSIVIEVIYLFCYSAGKRDPSFRGLRDGFGKLYPNARKNKINFINMRIQYSINLHNNINDINSKNIIHQF